jgi:predicted nuclease of predicted toxin-antitoxin system
VAHFPVDASLPGATAGLIQAHGHAATDVRDIGLGTATDDQIAAHARANALAVISGDRDFGDMTRYPPADYQGLVVVEPPRRATRAIILRLVEQFLNTPDVVAALPGRLVIVSPGRIRVRPPI